MQDEGVILRATLGGEDASYRLRVQTIGPQAVDRLRGDAHQSAGAEDPSGNVNVVFR